MPEFTNAKVIGEPEMLWSTPDGSRSIYKVAMDVEGDTLSFKTYSKIIATKGWEGNIVTEERPGRNGMETFVKQAPKEAPAFSGGHQSAKPFDTFTMYLSYAKDIVVAQIAALEIGKEDTSELLDRVLTGGYQLYNGRPDAPQKEETDG